MTMVSTGPISLGGTATSGGLNQSVNVELGFSGTATITMNTTAVRTLAGVPSGAISMSNFYGKSNRVALSYTYSANTADATLNVSTLSGYQAGKSDITITINSGVYVYATTTGGYALALSGATTGDTVTIVNNGYIMGMGGAGAGRYSGTNGGVGGPAINLGVGVSAVTINTQSGYIGGGGGGGGSAGYGASQGGFLGGGGAGGGAGGSDSGSYGGAGGSVGNSGGNGSNDAQYYVIGGGGGGRIMPGSGGAGGNNAQPGFGGGAGGGGAADLDSTTYGGTGGSGGSAGGNGTSGSTKAAGGGGGGYGASGGTAYNPATNSPYINSPGSGGKAVNLNAKSVTWTGGFNSGRVFGAVS